MKYLLKSGTVLGFIALFAACGDSSGDSGVPDPNATTPDGVIKTYSGKSDGWNERNRPSLFQMEFDHKLANLPEKGSTEKVAWAASYWPSFQDGINHRWQGNAILSPVEKYDKAFNGWKPDSDFMNLKPYDVTTCEFDAQYYNELGKAATYVNQNSGNYLAHNGIDDDGDGVSDADECSRHGAIVDFDGIETWFGICHAWAPASVLEDEPLKAIEHNGVRFETSDLKALLIQQYDYIDGYTMGGRCDEDIIERDASGRVVNEDCRDLNAGSWHIAITNLLGKEKRPFIIERTANFEVWNQPLIGYEILSQYEISIEKARARLNLQNIPGGNEGYLYNPEAVKFVEVKMKTSWVTESEAQIGPTTPMNGNYVEHDTYDYILELNANDEIIGGEWMAESNLTHPDFIWIATGQASGNPHISIEEVRKLIALSRDEGAGNNNNNPNNQTGNNDPNNDPGTEPAGTTLVYTNTEPATIPDVDPAGVRSPIDVQQKGKSGEPVAPDALGDVKSVKVSVNIKHDYRGDITIQLRHNSAVVTVFDGEDTEEMWTNDIVLTDQVVEGFFGTAVKGDWELIITDYGEVDRGSLLDWKLEIETK